MAKRYNEFIYNNEELYSFLLENNIEINFCFPPKFPLIARLLDGETYFVHFPQATLHEMIKIQKDRTRCQQ